ncbi:hypothetical protein [Pseudoclavibacter helvolus]|uniref:hypothetical protein n=1 Tax=Pseudoclavibacter helvolus TaxID=255205 RepID=UPI003C782850
MSEVIVFPDVEAMVVAYLRPPASEAGGSVATKAPSPLPRLFARVSRVGGSQRDIATDTARVLVECWGPDTVTASSFASLMRAHMLAIARATDSFTRVVDGGGITYLADPDTNKPRYQFFVQADVRGVAL